MNRLFKKTSHYTIYIYIYIYHKSTEKLNLERKIGKALWGEGGVNDRGGKKGEREMEDFK